VITAIAVPPLIPALILRTLPSIRNVRFRGALVGLANEVEGSMMAVQIVMDRTGDSRHESIRLTANRLYKQSNALKS